MISLQFAAQKTSQIEEAEDDFGKIRDDQRLFLRKSAGDSKIENDPFNTLL